MNCWRRLIGWWFSMGTNNLLFASPLGKKCLFFGIWYELQIPLSCQENFTIHICICVYYLEPKWPLFWLEKVLFWGLTFKNEGHWGSRYIYCTYSTIPFIAALGDSFTQPPDENRQQQALSRYIAAGEPQIPGIRWGWWYGWWKKSCTSWDIYYNPIKTEICTISTWCRISEPSTACVGCFYKKHVDDGASNEYNYCIIHPKKTKLAFYFAGLIHLHPSSPICGLPDQNSDPHPDLEKGPLDNLGSPAALKIRRKNWILRKNPRMLLGVLFRNPPPT